MRNCFVPTVQVTQEKATTCDHVVFLSQKPTDRKFRIIGYFLPTWWKYMGSQSEAINEARACAALHGADAIFLVNPEDLPGGQYKKAKFSAAIIIWE